MQTIKRIVSIAACCLLSFIRALRSLKLSDAVRRTLCAVCALSLLLASVPLSVHATSDDGLCQQSIELNLDNEESEATVKLDGMMPQNATATVTDVTGDCAQGDLHDGSELEISSVIAAYDISINDGADEFQPAEGYPIYVEISGPAIYDSGSIAILHIADDGTAETVEHFTIEDGKVGFYATGFSIYEIVEIDSGSSATDTVESVDELTSPIGFRLYYDNGKKYFCTSSVNNKGALSENTNEVQGAVWYFEEVSQGGETYYKMYTYVDNVKKYLHNTTVAGNGFSVELSTDQADLLQIETRSADLHSFYVKKSDKNWWIQHSNGGNGIRYYDSSSNEKNSSIYFKYASPTLDDEAIQKLTEKPYGLFHFATGSTVGNALMAEGDSHSLIELVLTARENHRVLYVDEDNEIDQWQFTYHETDHSFTVSVNSPSGTQYLCIDSSGISTTSDPANASKFNVAVTGDHVQLKSNGYYITYQPRIESDGGGYFTVTTDVSDENTWLNLLDRATLEENDLITFSADRVSVSDVPDGTKVIVYMRIWNEDELRYDIYAIDRDGSLYPCYASGGKILWLGDSTGSLEWEFTEYVDQVTKQPNYYYELYNPYSEKYLAPQLTGNQVLSDNPIGINMPGRRDGSFYSEAIAWDNNRYAYIGLRPNADKTALEPCAESSAIPIYFATLEELNLTDRLHEVPTLDNNQYGITMKMANFGLHDGKDYGASDGSDITWDYFGGRESALGGLKTGLLSSYLDENGYPITKTGVNFGGAFADAIPVNHLFLQSVHESGGYFEFDSTQNFATLKHEDENGNVVFNSGENGETNFILYRELGTHDRTSAYSLKHGQFFPYDTIKPGVYAKTNSQNLYTSLTAPNKPNMGNLPPEDPRKYEQLHLIQTEVNEAPRSDADYYFGMEMEASFVQTPSGLDAWGHDIIFEFTGDDDFWLYVDGQLVLDLGGVHSAQMGTINFRTGDVYFDKHGDSIHSETMQKSDLRTIFTNNYMAQHPDATQEELDAYLNELFVEGENVFKDYTTHTMTMFYMERGANASNLHMRFNIAAVTPGNVVVSKNVSGEGASELDNDFLEYPFQIYYTLPDGEGGGPGEWHLLGNDDENVNVYYQNSTQPVNFVRYYRPPGYTDEQAYENIYFINPSRNAEIAFPDNAITYKIVECAVNNSVYGSVTINGEEVPRDRIEINGDLRDYSSETGSALERPSISFDNHVNANVIKDLLVTKKLLDENGNEITDDPATFSFRLSISSYELAPDQIPLANMYNYYVLSPDKKICRFDPDTRTFAETSVEYSRDNIKSIQAGQVSGVSADDVTFKTSGFGAISGIPSGYTICVPGLPVGSVFKVTEDPKTGYGLIGYEPVMGTKIMEDHTEQDIPSYLLLENYSDMKNVGKVIADENPQMEVQNRKGYGISVKKEWSDLSITTGHSSIYTAVYVDGQLLEGSVKQIKSPSTSAEYFWTTLQPNANGTPRTTMDGYVVREVTISNQNPTVSADGTVTNPGTVTPLTSGSPINLTATRIDAVTPDGEDDDKDYNYIVTYGQKELTETSRQDTITNTREGGIAIRKFKWRNADSPTSPDIPLRNAQFTLTDGSGNTVGSYTSDADGIVTVLYDFNKNETYTLTETASPRGYVGLAEKLCFRVNNDSTVSLLYEDGQPWGTKDEDGLNDDLRWANVKAGSSGLSAFIDVYNKPFNFKLEKMDSTETGVMLDNAHFALYKQTNTSIGGYEKNRDPLTGFEDMVTVNGELYICGGDSGRSINPGSNGSVYFLTETQAPLNYTKLEDDIIFRVSPLGVPSLISDSYNGQLVETEDSYIYTLSVPNEKENNNKVLTVRKLVSGESADLTQEFAFTLAVEDSESTDTYEWYKNGVAQSEGIHPGDTFYLKHNETVEIAVPENAVVTISEQSGNYSASFKLDDEPSRNTSSLTFTVEEDTSLVVTNTLDHIVPTGVWGSSIFLLVTMMGAFAFVFFFLWKRKRE